MPIEVNVQQRMMTAVPITLSLITTRALFNHSIPFSHNHQQHTLRLHLAVIYACNNVSSLRPLALDGGTCCLSPRYRRFRFFPFVACEGVIILSSIYMSKIKAIK